MRRHLSTWALVAVVVAVFGVFLFYPIADLFVAALRLGHEPTLHYLANALERAWTQGWLTNSLLLATATTVAASVLAVPLAYLGARTSFRAKWLLQASVLVPMILPPFVGAIGLQALLGPRGMDLLRLYPLAGIVLIQALHLYPILYLNLVAGLASVDPSLEDAARSVGAGPWRTFRRVTFPLVLPTYFAGAILVFIWSFTDLGTPLILGYRGVIAHQIFDVREQAGAPDSNATVLLMLIVVAVLFLVARRLFGRRGFGMMSVATRAPEPTRLGRRGTLAAWILFGGVTLLAALPHVAVVLFSLAERWAGAVPEALTLAHHAEALSNEWTLSSIRNSVLYSVGAVAVCLVLSVWIGYVLVRKRFPGRGLLDAMVMLPLAVPGLVLAFGYLNAYAGWGDELVAAGMWNVNYLYPQENPVLLLVIAYAIRRLPLAVRASVAGFQQTSETLEEAAQSVGAGPLRTVWRITVPLILANLAAGAILTFAMSMLEVSDSLVLAQDDAFNPITRTIWRIHSADYLPSGDAVASALGVWAMVFLAVTLLGATALMGKRLGAIFRA